MFISRFYGSYENIGKIASFLLNKVCFFSRSSDNIANQHFIHVKMIISKAWKMFLRNSKKMALFIVEVLGRFRISKQCYLGLSWIVNWLNLLSCYFQ